MIVDLDILILGCAFGFVGCAIRGILYRYEPYLNQGAIFGLIAGILVLVEAWVDWS